MTPSITVTHHRSLYTLRRTIENDAFFHLSTALKKRTCENGIINELNKIDECFVDDDAKGIVEIMDRAKANTKLSNWTKQLIIHECKTALLELRI